MTEQNEETRQAAALTPTPEERAQFKRVLEALLFSSDRPIRAARFAEAADVPDTKLVHTLLAELDAEYERDGHAFTVEQVAGGYQLLTRPEYAAHIVRLTSRRQQETLSSAALECLAIVAYRQPITRAALEDIRGVGSGHLLRTLVDRRMLKVVGRAEELGRPMLYGTTRQFLEAFGLKSLTELPRRRDLSQAKTPHPKPVPEPEEEPEGEDTQTDAD
jgi:segregation and condensation protein B